MNDHSSDGVHEAAYAHIIDELSYKYDGVFDPESIRAAVAQARAELEPSATVTEFLPLLVARFAKERLLAAAQVDGRVAKEVPELLFICVHNAGRSQLAAAITEHLSSGRVHVRTAGSQPDRAINPDVVTVLAERGIDVTHAFPKPLADDVIMAADVIVTMGCGDTCPTFPGRRYEDWDVPDPAGQPLDVVRDIRDQIQARVTTLLRELNL